MKFDLMEFLTENWTYKLVAFFITAILWLTILGRRDFVMSKTIEVDLLTSPGRVVISQSSETIRVKVSGSRTALKKFMDSALSHSLAIDISARGDGLTDIQIPVDKIDLPLGVKIIGVKPSVIRAEVQKAPDFDSRQKTEQDTQ